MAGTLRTSRKMNHPANLRTLHGTQPGLLDPSQPSRLLRFPDASLSFASFDPKTAFAGEPGIPKHPDSGDRTPPKRIVVETTLKGASFWRFVPRAHLEDGVQDEGVWPRVVDICGEKVLCYQEQWEIYKLDHMYRCVVHAWPKCSTITWVDLPTFGSAEPYSGKRTQWPSPEPGEPDMQKRARSQPPCELDSDYDSDSDEEEVEEMVVGNSSHKPRSRSQASRDKMTKARLERWAKHRTAYERQEHVTTTAADGSFSMQVDSEGPLPCQSAPWPAEANLKRRGESLPESDDDSDRMSCDLAPREYKRSRTSPPRTRKRASQSPEKRRKDRLRKHAESNRQWQERSRFGGPLPFTFVCQEPVLEEDETPTEEVAEEDRPSEGERAHEAEIAESIRKLRELEKDRPMWEARRREREARERAEEEERLVRAERRRREEESRVRQEQEAAERRKREMEEEAERCARERRQQERRQRRRWESGLWTTQRALERYRALSEQFDAAKFTSGDDIIFEDIPWPVLHTPSGLRVEDVDWTAVEAFFAAMKAHMRIQDYMDFVEKSHRRFHPDRWRARRIWGAVRDDVERGYMEVAANTVAQAITPIWRRVKDACS